MITASSAVTIPQPDAGTFLGSKGVGGDRDGSYYRFGNDQHNHDKLVELFKLLWNFAQQNQVNVNELDFEAAYWAGPRCAVFEILWYEADDWASVENLPVSAEKYGEWTALIIRAAETVAHTIHYPHRLLRIADIHYYGGDRFVVTYTERS